jgi:uncharacterized membrane protein YdbT with pleckstrin-like domain
MSYVEKVLQPGERVIHTTGPHWLLYAPAALLLALAVLLAAASFHVGAELGLVALVAAVLVAVAAVVLWLRAFIRRATTELAVTDRRVIFKRGIFQRHTIEMNLAKVESIDVDQSIFGRILGFGTVTVHGTGGSLEPLRSIDDPLAFRSSITTLPVGNDPVR